MAFTYIASGTSDSGGAVSFTNIPQNYDSLYVAGYGIPAAASSEFWVRMNGVTTNSYKWVSSYQGTGGDNQSTNSLSFSRWNFPDTGMPLNSPAVAMNFEFYFPQYRDTNYKRLAFGNMYGQRSDSRGLGRIGATRLDTTAAISQLLFDWNTSPNGNMTLHLYGYGAD